MSASTQRYLAAICGLDHVIRSVPSDAWSAPSPCEGWSAREVAGHAMSVIHNVAAAAGLGDRVDPFTNPGAFAGEDPAETWRALRTRLFAAFDLPGALDNQVASASGSMRVDDYVAMVTPDALIHTWDIARATGVDERLDPDLVVEALAALAQRDESVLRAPGRYAEPIADSTTGQGGDQTDPAADAQRSLLRFAGRTP